MTLNSEKVQKITFFVLLSILIPLWNIPNTIAGRYICEGLLLIAVIVYKSDWRNFFSASKFLIIFSAYILIQLLFFSTDYQLAFSNFRAEWMHFILFSIIGAGAGLILGKNRSLGILLFLGIAFSIPLYIHLALAFRRGLELNTIPWGYWGINEIHGDLGYSALQASILLFTYYLYQNGSPLKKLITLLLIAICIFSPLLAASRGGVGFALFSILFIYLSYFFLRTNTKIDLKKIILGAVSIFILIGSVYQIGLISNPGRWGGIISRLSIGFQGDPISIYCNGITELEDVIKSKYAIITPAIQERIASVADGDGARVMAARSGATLILSTPMGINQSRQAYQQAIASKCGRKPAIFISHAHNAWIDSALAIGIPGVLLLLFTFLNYGRRGYKAFQNIHPSTSAFGMALFASSYIWILRGILDSTQRDQMLEMQAFVLAFLLGVILTNNTGTPKKDL